MLRSAAAALLALLAGAGAARAQEEARVVDLQLVRMERGSGEALVSSGIPLPAGWLRPGETRRVTLTIGGVEQAIHAEGLKGLHRDGSLRSLLIQTRQPLGTFPVYARLAVGAARRTADLPRAPTESGTLPAAVALPTDAKYIAATDLVGPTLPVSQTAPLGAAFQRYDADFARFADQHWQACAAKWDCGYGNYYDRARIYFAMWARTHDREYWRRGALHAADYRDGYLVPSSYGPSPHWSQLRGLETHYLLTGDERSRTAVLRSANTLYGGLHQWFDEGGWDNRHQARVLESYLLAWRLQDTSRDWGAALEQALPEILGTQAADGGYPLLRECGESLPYMVGILNDALAAYHRYFKADPRIPDAIRRSADWLWTQWVPAAGGFRYVDKHCPAVGSLEPSPDLNQLIVNSFGWSYQFTGNPTYLQRGDEVFRQGVAHALVNSGKQFNEAYSTSYMYPALRRR